HFLPGASHSPRQTRRNRCGSTRDSRNHPSSIGAFTMVSASPDEEARDSGSGGGPGGERPGEGAGETRSGRGERARAAHLDDRAREQQRNGDRPEQVEEEGTDEARSRRVDEQAR